MYSIFVESFHFLVRWIHLIAGISWIGNSFYFMWMDSSFEPLEKEKPGVEGELYMVHGGHFYHVEKQRFRPGWIPKTLHWFKWEATFTWLSGFVLLIVLYYANGGVYLIGPDSLVQDSGKAVLVSLAFLVGTWFVYDFFWQSSFAEKKKNIATAISLLAVIALCIALCRIFTGRGAFLHLGAIFATLMVMNVWIRILPRQKAMFDEAVAGKLPDYSAGPKAKARSTHNSYLTLPVLFAMLSNHFSLAYGAKNAWLVLFLLCLLGGFVRHMMLQWNYGRSGLLFLAPILAIFAAILLAINQNALAFVGSGERAPAFSKVQAIVQQRCLTCHSSMPTDPAFPIAPNGVIFERPEILHAYAEKIRQRVYVEKSMPLANRTNITEEERALLAAWVDGGAPIQDF